MILKLWVDDVRPAPEMEGWFSAKTVNEAISILLDVEDLKVVSLDHDLADFHGAEEDHLVELTGEDVLRFMKKKNRWPEKLFIHSANPVGKQRMKEFLIAEGPYRQMNVTRGGVLFFWDKEEEV